MWCCGCVGFHLQMNWWRTGCRSPVCQGCSGQRRRWCKICLVPDTCPLCAPRPVGAWLGDHTHPSCLVCSYITSQPPTMTNIWFVVCFHNVQQLACATRWIIQHYTHAHTLAHTQTHTHTLTFPHSHSPSPSPHSHPHLTSHPHLITCSCAVSCQVLSECLELSAVRSHHADVTANHPKLQRTEERPKQTPSYWLPGDILLSNHAARGINCSETFRPWGLSLSVMKHKHRIFTCTSTANKNKYLNINK